MISQLAEWVVRPESALGGGLGLAGVAVRLWRRRGAVAGPRADPWYRRWASAGLAPLYLGIATIKLKARDETIRQLRAINAEQAALIAERDATIVGLGARPTTPGPPSAASIASSSASGASTPPPTSPPAPTPSGSTSASLGSGPRSPASTS